MNQHKIKTVNTIITTVYRLADVLEITLVDLIKSGMQDRAEISVAVEFVTQHNSDAMDYVFKHRSGYRDLLGTGDTF